MNSDFPKDLLFIFLFVGKTLFSLSIALISYRHFNDKSPTKRQSFLP